MTLGFRGRFAGGVPVLGERDVVFDEAVFWQMLGKQPTDIASHCRFVAFASGMFGGVAIEAIPVRRYKGKGGVTVG